METRSRSWQFAFAPSPAPAGIGKRDSIQPGPRRAAAAESGLCALVAIVPLLFVGVQIATWIRNIPNWDEFDTVLDLLVALDQQPGPARVADLLLTANNEHRTLLSRLLFAASYWCWGRINFATIAIIGNLFLLGAAAIVIGGVPGSLPRWRLAAILGALLFQLTHHENFFWGGSSIDHFLVILAAVFTLRALAFPGRWALAAACVGGFGATFTLAHGMLVWPVGALLLAAARRWRALAFWSAAATVIVGAFFTGFHFNPGHPLPGLSALPRVFVHWLALVGAAPALDQAGLAPWLGVVPLVAGGALRWSGLREGERFAVAVAGWCLAALAMVAWGRALLADPWAPLTSRYVVLSSLAWALLGWVVLERALARTSRRILILAPVLAVLLADNVAANKIYDSAGQEYAQKAECALGAYRQFGTIAAAQPFLYPDPPRADALLRDAEARGLVRLPTLSALTLARPVPVRVEESHEVADAAYFIEAFDVSADFVTLRGWAFRPGHTLRPGDISVVLRAPSDLLAVHATTLLRPDVAREFKRRDAMFAGFDVRIPRQHLPAGKLGVGVGFDLDDTAEFMMTAHAIDNSSQ